MALIMVGFDGMKICSTGFARIDLLHLSKLVSLMGEFCCSLRLMVPSLMS